MLKAYRVEIPKEKEIQQIPAKYQEDWDLAQKCILKNREAQFCLFEKYKNSAYTICYRMLNDSDDATDALQDSFVALFKSLHSYKAKSSLWSWLKTVVVRTALAKQKKRLSFSRLEDIPHQFLEDTNVVWDENLTGEYLEQAIETLPTGYRTVFLLIEVEGYKHREVADMMGISVNTSKTQLFHAKKMLQKKLRDLL
jgi:RNA polymerase sigma-70 factor (ECF subfamily)